MKKPLKHIRITQHFGENHAMYKVYGMKGHNGLDFGAETDTEVYATIDGEIDNIPDKSGYGMHVVQVNNEYAVIYAHLSKFEAPQGSEVNAGTLIGRIGMTGNTTGPHLHFGVRILDKEGNIENYDNGYWGWVDPIPLLEPEEEAKSILNKIFELFKVRCSNPAAALIIIPDDYGRVYLVKNNEKRLAEGKDKIIEAILATLSVGVSKSDASKIRTGSKI